MSQMLPRIRSTQKNRKPSRTQNYPRENLYKRNAPKVKTIITSITQIPLLLTAQNSLGKSDA